MLKVSFHSFYLLAAGGLAIFGNNLLEGGWENFSLQGAGPLGEGSKSRNGLKILMNLRIL